VFAWQSCCTLPRCTTHSSASQHPHQSTISALLWTTKQYASRDHTATNHAHVAYLAHKRASMFRRLGLTVHNIGLTGVRAIKAAAPLVAQHTAHRSRPRHKHILRHMPRPRHKPNPPLPTTHLYNNTQYLDGQQLQTSCSTPEQLLSSSHDHNC
jgi:hypothetical protein